MPSDTAEFAAALERLRGEFRESVAELRGSINTLAATKDGEQQRIEAEIRDLREDQKLTTQTATSLHDRLDKYPPPDKVESTVSRVDRALWVGIGIAFGAGGTGGGIGYALAQILTNAP